MFPKDTLLLFSLDSVGGASGVWLLTSLLCAVVFVCCLFLKTSLPLCLRGVKEKEMYSMNVPEPSRSDFFLQYLEKPSTCFVL